MMEPTLGVAPPDTLIVRRLPEILTERDLKDLFQHFGAQDVRKEKPKGRMRKSTILVKFRSHEDASYALVRLHQLIVMGQRIIVEYADFTFLPQPQSTNQPTSVPENKTEWRFPAANQSIVKNISIQLMENPIFYEKVIQLMQSMSLPPPFIGNEGTHNGEDTEIQEVEMEELYKEDTEESELETSDNEVPGLSSKNEVIQPLPTKQKKLKQLKKPNKLTVMKITSAPGKNSSSSTAPLPSVSDMFEQSSSQGRIRKLQVKICPQVPLPVAVEESQIVVEGFGKFAPSRIGDENAEGYATGPPGDEDYHDLEFISQQKLSAHRITEQEMKLLPVFKNYSPGAPNSRLYLKNLAKTVKESDLKHIYGRYVVWTSEEECNMFDIRLMTVGRMKGQAFITLPSVYRAEKAISETNGFMLQGRPLVVQFARSATKSVANVDPD